MALSEKVKQLLKDFYARNPYVKMLGMKIEKAVVGSVELSMVIESATHINAYRVAHGGALMSLADTAMGASCLSVHKKVVTLEFNINCMKAVPEAARVLAAGRILHSGKKTIVAECEITGEDGVLYAKARASFYVIEDFTESAQ